MRCIKLRELFYSVKKKQSKYFVKLIYIFWRFRQNQAAFTRQLKSNFLQFILYIFFFYAVHLHRYIKN